MPAHADDGTPLVRPYMDRADAMSAQVMGQRRQRAANARTGLAILELTAAQQNADRAQRRLQDAQRRVEESGVGEVATAVRRYLQG